MNNPGPSLDAFPPKPYASGMETTQKTKDVEVFKTDLYTLIKILHPTKKKARGLHHSFVDLVGVLKDVPALKGKSSVEVQHMAPDLWITRKGKHARS
jgi:hypothetical protein